MTESTRRYIDYDAFASKARAKEAKRASRLEGTSAASIAADEEQMRRERQQRIRETQSKLSQVFANPERIAELRQVERERVQLDLERKLGVKSKADTGVRFESTYK